MLKTSVPILMPHSYITWAAETGFKFFNTVKNNIKRIIIYAGLKLSYSKYQSKNISHNKKEKGVFLAETSTRRQINAIRFTNIEKNDVKPSVYDVLLNNLPKRCLSKISVYSKSDLNLNV